MVKGNDRNVFANVSKFVFLPCGGLLDVHKTDLRWSLNMDFNIGLKEN